MAGNVWSIVIVPGAECASFVPDVYVPAGTEPKTALQAQVNDMVSWNNQTEQEHEIWQTSGGQVTQLTQQIDPGMSSTPGYIVTGTAGTAGTIEYYCSIHDGETGSIDVIS
jgi:plastocyanin